MSDAAKSLMHYASHWREGCADCEGDRAFCFHAARCWAAHLIGLM